ncbi:hypothetical protein K469DRAFT_619959, partial [Zopfia rhizophila CBS 207.26]
MIRPALRLIARPTAVRALPRAAPTRRFLSTPPPARKSRSWKSSAVRWGIAAGIIYYYQTSDVFAEEPTHTTQHLPETEDETEQLPTIEALAEERQQRKDDVAASEKAVSAGQEGTAEAGGVEELEEEADQQGAFNPETGEINWDCPCLGGMAHGPCGEEFKAAFSCFVHSTEEPKGMDCIDKFKGMQNCFRQYPEIYGSELESDDDEDDVTADDGEPAIAQDIPTKSVTVSAPSSSPAQSNPDKVAEYKPEHPPSSEPELQSKKEHANAATEQVKKHHEPQNESNDAVPKAWYDQTAKNE